MKTGNHGCYHTSRKNSFHNSVIKSSPKSRSNQVTKINEATYAIKLG